MFYTLFAAWFFLWCICTQAMTEHWLLQLFIGDIHCQNFELNYNSSLHEEWICSIQQQALIGQHTGIVYCSILCSMYRHGVENVKWKTNTILKISYGVTGWQKWLN